MKSGEFPITVCRRTISFLEAACNAYRASDYMFKVNNRKTKTRSEICSKSTINTSARRRCRHFTVLTYFSPCSGVSTVIFKQVNAGCLITFRKQWSHRKYLARSYYGIRLNSIKNKIKKKKMKRNLQDVLMIAILHNKRLLSIKSTEKNSMWDEVVINMLPETRWGKYFLT